MGCPRAGSLEGQSAGETKQGLSPSPAPSAPARPSEAPGLCVCDLPGRSTRKDKRETEQDRIQCPGPEGKKARRQATNVLSGDICGPHHAAGYEVHVPWSFPSPCLETPDACAPSQGEKSSSEAPPVSAATVKNHHQVLWPRARLQDHGLPAPHAAVSISKRPLADRERDSCTMPTLSPQCPPHSGHTVSCPSQDSL